jgi:hypothetical protein
MAYLPMSRPRAGLRGPQPNAPCCASCASGGVCEEDQLAPPDVMQGPWMGPRLVYDLNATSSLPQTGGLPPLDAQTDSWNFQLQNLEDRWQG